MSMCNYCTMKDMERRTANDQKLTRLGNNFYRAPSSDPMPEKRGPNQDKWKMKYFVAWLMEIPSSCRC